MPNFMFVYHGGKAPEDEAGQQEAMARWGEWMHAHEAALTDPGNPVGMSKTVSASGVEDNGGANPTSGYTIVRADTIETALDMARTNPIIAEGGTIEVAEIIPVEM